MAEATVRGSAVPKIIHMLWLQGLDAAPDLVKHNMRRWAALNPGYRMNLLDQGDVDRMFGKTSLPIAGMRPQALADLVRMRLLLDQGGIWVDGSILPVRPLDDWLPQTLTPVGFFAFAKPGPDRPLSNWFLVSTAGNPILQAWWDAALAFWTRPRRLVDGIPDDPVAAVATEAARSADTYPYFWPHYLFRSLLEQRQDFAALWAGCAPLSADPPHAVNWLFTRQKRRPWWLQVLRAGNGTPLHKLDWRKRYPMRVLALLR